MSHTLSIIDAVAAVGIGIGATLVIDGWNLGVKRVLGIPSLSYCMLGRWVSHMRNGVFRHRAIAKASAKPFECAIGWATHYAIGVALATAFIVIAPGWLARPTLAPALLYGVATVAFPFFVMQPSLGLGVASAATPRPTQARLKSLATHTAFGVGLYVFGIVAAYLLPR